MQEITKIRDLFQKKNDFLNQEVIIKGWVRFNRVSKTIGFIELFEGSRLNGIQVVYKTETNPSLFEELSKLTLFSGLKVKGIIVEGKNNIELNATEIIEKYPCLEEYELGKKEHGFEFLRDIAQIRPRTKYFQSVFKIRSKTFQLLNRYFEERDFINVSTPIITANDAEGAGESFIVKTKDNKTFFTNQGSLAVSGQLHVEAFAQAFQRVYTFGPTFRAENSNTVKHLAEFWMLEPEIAFCDYNQAMNLVFDMLKSIMTSLLKYNKYELELLSKLNDVNLIERYENFINSTLSKISYRQALEILKRANQEGIQFENTDFSFGVDLKTEHEKYLAGEYAKSPIFVYDYPASIKSFYMHNNGDGTVRGFDFLVPDIGELAGGSQREGNYDKLIAAMKSKNIPIDDLKWYIDLRKEGYATSSGFGLGFERLIMYLTGVENIKDVIPYPRATGKLHF